MNIDLTGKLALVTGSTRGIGLATAIGLARMGAEVIVNGRESPVTDAIAKVKQAVPAAKAHAAVFDLGQAEGCAALMAQFPEVDILVNNLGIYEPKPFFDVEDDDWTRMFEVNVMSGVRLTRHYLKRHARCQGLGPRRVRLQRIRDLHSEGDGALRLLESRPAHHRARRRRTDQRHQHHRQFGIARSDLGRDGAGPAGRARQGPGTTADELAAKTFTERRPSSLLQRYATPEEVANLICYVCSKASSATNGAALRADGGIVTNPF